MSGTAQEVDGCLEVDFGLHNPKTYLSGTALGFLGAIADQALRIFVVICRSFHFYVWLDDLALALHGHDPQQPKHKPSPSNIPVLPSQRTCLRDGNAWAHDACQRSTCQGLSCLNRTHFRPRRQAAGSRRPLLVSKTVVGEYNDK